MDLQYISYKQAAIHICTNNIKGGDMHLSERRRTHYSCNFSSLTYPLKRALKNVHLYALSVNVLVEYIDLLRPSHYSWKVGLKTDGQVVSSLVPSPFLQVALID